MKPAASRREVRRLQGYELQVVGVPAASWRDVYHAMLRMPWWQAFGVIVGTYLAVNAVFAVVYMLTGGIANAHTGSFADAFFFSVQTMGTIGYGAMTPTTLLANVLVVAESVTSLLITALATGFLFARFSRIQPRVVFSSRVAIAPMNGVPTLMIRVGNERRGQIVDALFRASITRTARTDEGVVMYRTSDLRLERDRAWALSRSWMVFHRIDEESPLAGATPASVASDDLEVTLTLIGLDEASGQPMHALRQWPHSAIAWGARFADMISEPDPTTMIIDMTRFDDIEPTPPTADFPYGA